MMEDFSIEIDSIIRRIGEDHLKYDETESWMYNELYESVREYAYDRRLLNTSVALPVVRKLLSGVYRGFVDSEEGHRKQRAYMYHCLSVTRMLIDLHLPVTHEEKDILLAGALCHDLKSHVYFPDHGQEMNSVYHLDQRIVDIMMLIYVGDCHSDEDYSRVFSNVRENKLAMLIRFADRANIVEELYNFSMFRMQEYIHETRDYYLPMCIYAREFYPELDQSIGTLQSKMSDLIASTDIFITRYDNRQRELSEKILLLEEENARMRTVLRQKAGLTF
ncbi:MAG: hypothetical protein Q4B03_10210 [Lachnospiraceae bacterium]|nr:hypothetical protein [Lachnospiraceae bacterium]